MKLSDKQIEEMWFLEDVIADLGSVSFGATETVFQVEDRGFKIEVADRIDFNSAAAFAYARSYCKKTNTCGKRYEDKDCAHFMSHCLAAGGIAVTGLKPEFECPQKLCISAQILAAAFYNASEKFSNISQLSGHKATKRGDYGFFKRFFDKNHSFLLNAKVESNGKGAKIYGHSNDRCGERVGSSLFGSGYYYRIS